MNDAAGLIAFVACLIFGVVGFVAGYADGRHDERLAHDLAYLAHEPAEYESFATWGCVLSILAVIVVSIVLVMAWLR